ncbi:hypothetical protein NQZ79_g6653 [Umbelopsis isabellina]|nr:hypothetical protein NQZ79_g6653 [Umbelopsis isabellina]
MLSFSRPAALRSLTQPHCSENTFNTSYGVLEAKTDYQQITEILQQLENNARSSGLLSLSDNAPEEGKQEQPPPAKSLATRNSETMQAVEQNFTEQSRLVSNVQTAINTSSHKV